MTQVANSKERVNNKTYILANSYDPDEMLHDAAFHQGRNCLLTQKQSSGEEIQLYLEIITCDPSNYTMDHPKLIVSYQRKTPFAHILLI